MSSPSADCVFSPSSQDVCRSARKRLPFLGAALLSPFMFSNLLAFLGSGDARYLVAALATAAVSVVLAIFASELPGEMMIICFVVVGIINESAVMGGSQFASDSIASHEVGTAAIWLVLAASAGAIAAAFCKTKDVVDNGCLRRSDPGALESALQYRRLNLYLAYTIGVWVGAFLVSSAGSFLKTAMSVIQSIFFLLSIVGYLSLTANVLANRLGIDFSSGVDPVLVAQKLVLNMADASFLKVSIILGICSCLASWIAIPTYIELARRCPHTLLSAIAISSEVVLYQVMPPRYGSRRLPLEQLKDEQED